MRTDRTRRGAVRVLIAGALAIVVVAVVWRLWPRTEPVDAAIPERVPVVVGDEAPVTLSAGGASEGTPRRGVAPPESEAEAEADNERPASSVWRLRVRAEMDGHRYSLSNCIAVATRTHPGETISPVPAPHIAYDAGVWRPDERSRHEGRLLIFEPPPLHASLVIGNTVMDTVRLEGDETGIVFQVSKPVLEQSRGTFSFRVVDAETGETPKHDGFRVAARGAHPGRSRFPFTSVQRTNLGEFYQGPYTLYLGGIHYGERRIEFDIEAGRNTDLGVIELHSTTGIRGHVVNPAGEVIDVRVVARRPGEPETVGGGDFTNFGTDFYLGSLPPGEIWVTVDSPDWASFPVWFEVSDGILEDAVVPAYEGTPVTLERSALARGRTRATITTAGGQVAWHGKLDVGDREALRLVPGAYTLTTDPGEERPLQVGVEPQRVDL